MKLSIERGALLKSLSHVQSVVEKRNTIPILSNVQLEAADGVLALTATDLDISIIERAEASVGEAGATTAPAHTLFDIVRKLPDGAEVELALDGDQRLDLTSGRSHFTLSCLPREDFPELSEGDLPHSFSLSAADTKRFIDKTRFAISTEETRYYLNGIYLHVAGDDASHLRAVATDGHRLAQIEIDLPDGAEGMPGVIVPRKTVGELRKLVDEYDGDVQIALSDTKIRFSFADVVLTSKLIDGTFPDYTRVIPTQNDRILEVEGKVLSQAVDRVSTISSERTRSVKLSIENNQIDLSVNSPEYGSAREKVEADYTAEAMEIGFNAHYLLDILAQIKGDQVRLEFSDQASPTVLRDSADDGALFVLMPMRV